MSPEEQAAEIEIVLAEVQGLTVRHPYGVLIDTIHDAVWDGEDIS